MKMKILITQTAFLGDVILITPLIRATREIFPEAQIDALVIPQTADALRNNPHLNEIIEFDKRNNKILSFFRILHKLRKRKYDISITPHGSMTTALLLEYAGIPMRIGFNRWNSAKHWTHKVRRPDNVHVAERNLALLSPLTNKKFSPRTELFPSSEDFEASEKNVAEIKGKTRKLIAVAPGSVWFTKRWPTEYYRKLVMKLSEENFGIILIGAENEREICEKVSPEKNAVNFAGKLSVLQSAAAIKQCDLLICNDSGALHMANAVETDVFAFFGPTVKALGYFPFRQNDFVFELDLDCRPCGSHGGKTCPLGHHDCMRKIYPDYVFEKITEKFE